MTKKLVLYDELLTEPREGFSCILIPYNHPDCSNYGHPAMTSEVIEYDPNTGNIETLNTLWKLNPNRQQ